MSDLNPPKNEAFANEEEEGGDHTVPSKADLIEVFYKAFLGRRNAFLDALIINFEKFYSECDPKQGKLSLLAFDDSTWKVVKFKTQYALPYALSVWRDKFSIDFWRRMIASYADSWLLKLAVLECCHSFFDSSQRQRLFSMIDTHQSITSLVMATFQCVKDSQRILQQRNNMISNAVEIGENMNMGAPMFKCDASDHKCNKLPRLQYVEENNNIETTSTKDNQVSEMEVDGVVNKEIVKAKAIIEE